MSAVIDATSAMNRMYRRKRHVYDLTRRYYLLGRDELIERLRPSEGEGVLEIGCGTARNLVRAAKLYPGVRFFGIDVSTEMLTTAIHNIERAGLSARIRVAHADAARFSPRVLFGRDGFERVFFSYCLSMMPSWRSAIDGGLAVLRPAGEMHIVDFGRQEGLPQLVRAALRRWLAAFHVAPPDALEGYLRLRAGELNASAEVAPLYRGYAQIAEVRVPARRPSPQRTPAPAVREDAVAC